MENLSSDDEGNEHPEDRINEEIEDLSLVTKLRKASEHPILGDHILPNVIEDCEYFNRSPTLAIHVYESIS